ncbi:hypothetical protein AMAG_14285 [Allomyces macrogynus ATCC 38327]|uniref:Uncharacterized protein n=1 Tax=Allomyces macrogynus (strain ATCC 38327) TaxID=578462 RepID=A0A0L0T5B0_ALLM3|nr:hypothetical protein AMAG_14285 [Allomyces macrogynus ATCC 38327]|eukprot:KNE69744.1 hypothetical protein AMAG_14285 [Allomyces macrogynus ATCC 38327]
MPTIHNSTVVKLNVPDVINLILVKAVHLHARDDVHGLAQYARTMLRRDIPSVLPAILFHAPALAPEVASAAGDLVILDAWRDVNPSKLQVVVELCINKACLHERVNVLEWWRVSGMPLKYSSSAMDMASKLGHVRVLQWWRDSGLKLKYSRNAVSGAAARGHIVVLEWWNASGLEFPPIHHVTRWV